MIKILVFSPFALENGRGGEISSMELASGFKNYYNVDFIDTYIITSEKLLSKDIIQNRLEGVNYIGKIKIISYNIFNKIFTLPHPKGIFKLYHIVMRNDIAYFSIFNFKNILSFIFLSLICRNTHFIVGYRKPLYSEKIISLYNLKYRLSILVLSLFKKRFTHHVLTRSAKKYLTNFYDKEKIVYITHGISLKDYEEDNFSKKNNKILNFVYIGYLDDVHKGVGILLKAIDELLVENQTPNVRFEFCGMGPLEGDLKTLEEKYPNYVKFNGYIDNEKIPDYYKKNDVYLFSSKSEPFPRVLMEALASNELIICSQTIGSNELLNGKPFAFFLEYLNSKQIKEKIAEVYNLWNTKPNKFKQLQIEAKKYVFENYSFSKELEMFKDLIDNISKK